MMARHCFGVLATKKSELQQNKAVQNSVLIVLWQVSIIGLTGGFLLLQNFNVAISVSPRVCFILVLILISMFLR